MSLVPGETSKASSSVFFISRLPCMMHGVNVGANAPVGARDFQSPISLRRVSDDQIFALVTSQKALVSTEVYIASFTQRKGPLSDVTLTANAVSHGSDRQVLFDSTSMSIKDFCIMMFKTSSQINDWQNTCWLKNFWIRAIGGLHCALRCPYSVCRWRGRYACATPFI